MSKSVFYRASKFFFFFFNTEAKNNISTSILSTGGLHSGCGISAMMWLVLSWGYHIMDRHLYHYLVLASLFLSMIVAFTICALATPLVRALNHK
jgi:hypothetical protein